MNTMVEPVEAGTENASFPYYPAVPEWPGWESYESKDLGRLTLRENGMEGQLSYYKVDARDSEGPIYLCAGNISLEMRPGANVRRILRETRHNYWQGHNFDAVLQRGRAWVEGTLRPREEDFISVGIPGQGRS